MNGVETTIREVPANGAAHGESTSLASAPLAGASDAFEAERRAEKAGALVMSARSALRKERKSEAKKLLKESLALSPTDCAGLELLGDIFMEEAEQEKALRVFEHGLKFHPNHVAFEQKIALCILDIEEMKRHRAHQENLLEHGDSESWMNVSPNRAFGLSVFLPGAGHFYIEEAERGAYLLGGAVLAFLGWTLPLYFGLKGAAGQGVGLGSGISTALKNMSGIGLLWFWLMVLVWIGVYIYAAFDAMLGAERANERRKQGFEEFNF